MAEDKELITAERELDAAQKALDAFADSMVTPVIGDEPGSRGATLSEDHLVSLESLKRLRDQALAKAAGLRVQEITCNHCKKVAKIKSKGASGMKIVFIGAKHKFQWQTPTGSGIVPIVVDDGGIADMSS